MPLYEYRKNAVNFLKVPAEWKSSIVTGGSEVADFIVARIAERQKEKAGIRAAFEGWYGVDWPRIMDAVKSAAGRAGLRVTFCQAASLARSADEIAAYGKTFETDDPSFGWVNAGGTIEDVFDAKRVRDFREELTKKPSTGAVIVMGPGADMPALDDLYDLRFYFDFTMQPMLWQMWDGTLVPFGRTQPDPATPGRGTTTAISTSSTDRRSMPFPAWTITLIQSWRTT